MKCISEFKNAVGTLKLVVNLLL